MAYSERIKIICSHLVKAKTFADVGCDHGYMSEYALKNGLCEKLYFSDVSKGSLKKAEKLLAAEEEYLAGIEQDIQNAHVRSYTLSFNGAQYEVAVHKVSNRRRPQ